MLRRLGVCVRLGCEDGLLCGEISWFGQLVCLQQGVTVRVKCRKRSGSVKLVADDDRLVSRSGLLVVERVVERLGLEGELTDAVGLEWRTQRRVARWCVSRRR